MRAVGWLAALSIPVLAAACTSLVGLKDLPVPEDASTDGTVADGGADTSPSGDGGHADVTVDGEPGVDSGQEATVAPEGGGAEGGEAGGEASVCTQGAPCTPANPCDQGTTDCSTGTPVCNDTGPSSTANGTSCGTGEVCANGGCVACAAGVTCTPANACHVWATSCATGAAACADTGAPVADGTTCGTGMVCESGTCVACVQGSSCAPTTKPCDTGTIDCTTGTPTCNDTGNVAPNGTMCGGGNVCESGTCSACSAGTSCPPANTCHTGTLSCAAGSATCKDTGTAVPNGTPCGTGMACENGTCCSAVEICGNGIDDNCNGLIDCADPYCTTNPGGWACTDLPQGSGWTMAAYDSTARPSCPTNFATTPSDVYTDIAGSAATCSCTCNNTVPASCVGNWCWGCWQQASSCNAADEGTCESIYNGTCVLSSADDPIDNWYCEGHESGVATKAGTCGAKLTTVKPAVTDDAGETCAVAVAGGGCTTGVCAPVAPVGFQLCSYNAGAPSCPNGLIQSTVYTGYDDTRTCGNTCACGTVDLACNVTGRKYFSQNNCTSSSFNMSTSCAQSPLKDTYAWQVDLSTNDKQSDCTVTTGSTASGSVSPTGAITMCCAP